MTDPSPPPPPPPWTPPPASSPPASTPPPASSSSPPPSPADGLPPVEWLPPADGLPSYAPTEPVSARRRSPARLAAVGVAFVALLAGSAFAVYALTRPDGTDSPEGAVHQMFSAIDHEDALGVVESLPPGERKVLHDPLVDSTKQLQRLGVLKSFSLSDVPGADIKVSGLTTETTTLGDGVVLVNVTGGTISGVTIPKDVPVGDTLRKAIEDSGGTVDIKADTFSEDLANDHLHLVTIKEGGGWHVSLAYSLAESIRSGITDEDGKHPPLPTFGNGPTPVGSDTPDGAVKGLVDGAVHLDAEQVITMTDPEEMRALYDYAPLFLPNIQQSVRDHKSDGDVVKVDKLDTTVEGDGDVRRVTITGFDVTIGSPTDNTHIAYDGRCYDLTSTYTDTFVPVGRAVYPDGTLGPDPSDPSVATTGKPQVDHQHFCAGDSSTSSDSSTSPDAALFGGLGAFGSASSKPFAVTVTQVDGRWYVSPVRTILDSAVEALTALQPSDIEKWGSTFDSSSDSCCGSSGSSDFGPGSDGGTTGTLPVYPVDPTNPPDTLPSDVGSMPLAGLTLATQDKVFQACSTQADALFPLWLGTHDAAYFQATRDLYGCASGIVPGYTACLPRIDQAVIVAKQGGPTHDAEAAMILCVDRVTG